MRARRLALVALLVLALLGLPGLAAPVTSSTAVITSTALPLSAVVPLSRERLLGVTWAGGSPRVRLRWHTPTGWSAWQQAEDDSADSPVGTPGTAPQWRPPLADRAELRTTGPVTGLRLVRVSDRPVRGPAVARAAGGRELLGPVRSRADWGADESVRRGRPSYASRVSAVVVHHTVNANGYSRQDVPAIIRADYAYHVRARGWADLGYNLLVDQFGGIWEGRAGGLGRATIGAHAEGFNTGTLGVAVIGDLTRTTATRAAEKALARVIGYAALTWRFDPTASVTLTSRGSARFPRGRQVRLPRVFGHQDTSATACPGSVQSRLPALRALAVVAMGPAPALTRVDVTGVPLHAPAPMELTAQLSLPAAWSVTVTSPDGRTVARSTGTGRGPRLTWDGLSSGVPALPGRYTWTVTADDGFHDVTRRSGSFEVGLPVVPL